jgi:hypothetical protein
MTCAWGPIACELGIQQVEEQQGQRPGEQGQRQKACWSKFSAPG